MKITPTPGTSLCRRCLLPAAEPHPDLQACLLMHQGVLHNLGQEYDKLKTNNERATRGMKEMIKLLWKLVIGRGVIAFTKAEIDAIPTGANVTVQSKLDGSLIVTAIVKDPKERPS